MVVRDLVEHQHDVLGVVMAEVYPTVPYRPTTGDTLLSIEKARKLLGYQPVWSWRDHIAERTD